MNGESLSSNDTPMEMLMHVGDTVTASVRCKKGYKLHMHESQIFETKLSIQTPIFQSPIKKKFQVTGFA
jgi:hypothetical protein